MHMMQSQNNFENQASTGSTSAGSSRPIFWNWLGHQGSLVRDLYISLAGDIARIFDLFARSIFKEVAGEIVDASLVVIQGASSVWGDFENIVALFYHHNLGAIASMAMTFSWNLIQAVVMKANWWQKAILADSGVVTSLRDAATGGAMEAALATLGVFQLVTDITLNLGMDLNTYNTIYPNG
jgi:hypothetical protein